MIDILAQWLAGRGRCFSKIDLYFEAYEQFQDFVVLLDPLHYFWRFRNCSKSNSKPFLLEDLSCEELCIKIKNNNEEEKFNCVVHLGN